MVRFVVTTEATLMTPPLVTARGLAASVNAIAASIYGLFIKDYDIFIEASDCSRLERSTWKAYPLK